MPAPREDPIARRSVVPPAAGQSLWRAALWTGAGTAVLAAVVAIAVVAVCWLPASGTSGSAGSAIRAGLLTFLAALHGGITVSGVHALFVPAGMTIMVGVLAWRAGCGLADAAADLDENRPEVLLRAAALQTAAFALVCIVAASGASLGTSNASPVAVGVFAVLLFGSCAGAAMLRWSTLGASLTQRFAEAAPVSGAAARTALAALGVHAVAAALLVAGSLVEHHDRVSELSQIVGGGWSGAPVLVLGLLAAPNTVIAGSAYLAGPGFAFGSGTSVSLVSTAHGTLPAFPVLGALPIGHGASWPVWLLAVATCLSAGAYAARGARRFGAGLGRWRVLGVSVAMSAVAGAALAWFGGGSLGPGRLGAVGASPWQLGLAFGVEIGVVGAAGLAISDVYVALRARRDVDDEQPVLAVVRAAREEAGKLLGGLHPDERDDDEAAAAESRGKTGTGGSKLAG